MIKHDIKAQNAGASTFTFFFKKNGQEIIGTINPSIYFLSCHLLNQTSQHPINHIGGCLNHYRVRMEMRKLALT